MSTTSSTTVDFSVPLPLKQFSTADYLQMIEAGILGPKHRVELIGGMIVEMSPAGIPRNGFLINIVDLFAPLIGRFRLAVQATLTVAEGQVFDPDFMLLTSRSDRYKSQLPQAGDVCLVIEAADSSLQRDQCVKMPIYSGAGVPEYWIADLEREVLIVHREPQPGGYRLVEKRSGDDIVSPLAAPDFSFAVRQAFD